MRHSLRVWHETEILPFPAPLFTGPRRDKSPPA